MVVALRVIQVMAAAVMPTTTVAVMVTEIIMVTAAEAIEVVVLTPEAELLLHLVTIPGVTHAATAGLQTIGRPFQQTETAVILIITSHELIVRPLNNKGGQ